MRVPKKHYPTFTSMLCTGILLTLHLLIVLLQIWNVKFNVWMNYVAIKTSGYDNEGSVVGVDIPEEWMELDEDINPLLKPINKSSGESGTNKGNSNTEGSSEALLKMIEVNNTTLSIPKHLPTHAVITPTKTTESSILLPIIYLPTIGITFEYHRRRYYYDYEFAH